MKLFGTDGIRGEANKYPMVPEIALAVGKAAALILGKDSKRPKIVIGKDTRVSGYIFEFALTSGICSVGADVLLVGPLPTPAIAHLTKSLNADAGIVISASHNPAGHNGIKLFDKNGFKLPDEVEQQIEDMVLAGEITNDPKELGKTNRVKEARGRYIEFAKHTIKNRSLKGLKVVIDCANGAAYYVAPTIFSELGAEIIILNNEPDGNNINKDCGALHPEGMQEAVKAHKADIGIALDGDADRIIVCDENGEIVDGDHILAICALALKEKGRLNNHALVGTVMSNLGFEIAMNNAGIKLVKTKVGDRYVIEEMRKNNYVLGGEQSGHIIFMDHITTGDGIITGLQLINVILDKKQKLSELAQCMKTLPQVLVNIKVKEKKDFQLMPEVKNKTDEIDKKLGSNGRTLIRYSGTENLARVMIEGMDKEKIKEYADEIAAEIKKEIGVDDE